MGARLTSVAPVVVVVVVLVVVALAEAWLTHIIEC